MVYQIYPKSFKDSNGDGMGDLRGVTEKLDYLADMGVDYLWLTPFFVSPQKDNGYDVADYLDIDPHFGTMADFDALVQAADAKGLKIMLDMVLCHTSDQHAWFQRALAGDEKYQRYYILRDGRNKKSADDPGEPPTNWAVRFRRQRMAVGAAPAQMVSAFARCKSAGFGLDESKRAERTRQCGAVLEGAGRGRIPL